MACFQPVQSVEALAAVSSQSAAVHGQMLNLPQTAAVAQPPPPAAAALNMPAAMPPAPIAGAGSPPTAAGAQSSVHVRGGTTYFAPQIQSRADPYSPVRRAKEPLPIVDPKITDVSVKMISACHVLA